MISNLRITRHVPTSSGARRPVRRVHVGRSPGSRVTAFSGLPGRHPVAKSENAHRLQLRGQLRSMVWQNRTTSNSLYPKFGYRQEFDFTQITLSVKRFAFVADQRIVTLNLPSFVPITSTLPGMLCRVTQSSEHGENDDFRGTQTLFEIHRRRRPDPAEHVAL